jgi:hypothetical protein
MRHSNDWRLRAAAVLLGVTVACSGGGGDGSTPGGGDSTPGGGTGPETASLFCDALYDTFAARWATCSKAPLTWATQLIVKEKLCPRLVYAVTAEKATYDRTDAGACLSFFESASCAELRGVRDGVEYVTACHTAVTGTGASGYPYTSCDSDYECASGRCLSAAYGAACPGTCYAGYAVGASCNGDRYCAAGLYCQYPGSTCQPYSEIPGDGETCYLGVGCQPGLWCEGSVASGDPGTCRPQVSAGACPADPKGMAPGYGCFTGTALPLLALGEACTNFPDRCGPGLYCGAGNVCTQEPLVGDACAYWNGAYQGCIGGYCGMATYTCRQTVDPCYTDWDCASRGYCANGTCEPFCR